MRLPLVLPERDLAFDESISGDHGVWRPPVRGRKTRAFKGLAPGVCISMIGRSNPGFPPLHQTLCLALLAR